MAPAKEIIKNNELIAQYMGGKLYGEPHVGLWSLKIKDNKNPYYVLSTKMKYHKDWNWLMPVVEKIGNYTFDDVGKGQEPEKAFMRTFYGNMARINRFPLHEATTQIEATYAAVVEFIEFLNLDMK